MFVLQLLTISAIAKYYDYTTSQSILAMVAMIALLISNFTAGQRETNLRLADILTELKEMREQMQNGSDDDVSF